MLNNKGIKDIQSLRDKKSRDASGLFVAEGPKIVTELIAAAPEGVVAIYALPKWVEENQKTIQGLTVETLDTSVLQRISQLQTPNQVLGVFKIFKNEKPAASKEWCLYLDTIQDPGNMGTIIRLADWFAIPNVVCSAGCVDMYNAKVVQSTMASLARVNIWYDMDENWLQEQTASKWAASLSGTSLYHIGHQEKGIIMIGNESKGLRTDFLELATQKITIPRLGSAESLNAAVATGIILSHLVGGQKA